jgi:hypothetical protein
MPIHPSSRRLRRADRFLAFRRRAPFLAGALVAAIFLPRTSSAADGIHLKSADGDWDFAPSGMAAVRLQQEARGGVLVERGIRLQATRLVLHAVNTRWKTQFHYQFHSDEGRLATGNVYIQWDPSPYFGLLVGQNRVPYNREHITGYFYHQLPDRSLTNGRFGLQRDLGVAASVATKEHRWEAVAGLWNGARLAAANDDTSFQSTLRLAWNPRGTVDFREGDLARERHPKVSVALAGAYNPRRVFALDPAKPNDLVAWTSIRQAVLEGTLRWRGLSITGETHVRYARRPEGVVGEFGQLLQVGMFVAPKVEGVLRVAAFGADRAMAPKTTTGEYAVGGNVYVSGHRLKIQGDVALLRAADGQLDPRIRLQTSVIF